VAAQPLEFDHHPRQAVKGDLPALGEMADGVVLAERAAQVAMSEEDRSRAANPDERPFFAEMGRIGRNFGEVTGSAGASLSLEPVDAAVAGTDAAIFQDLEGPLDSLGEKPVAVRTKIGRFKVVLFHASSSPLYQ